MGEIHNLQIVIAQSPLLSHLNEGQTNVVPNGSHILKIVSQEKTARKQKTVRELSEAEKIDKEDPKKRRIKKSSSDHLIDLHL